MIGVPNLMFLKNELVMTLLASTQVFHKKKIKYILVFVILNDLYVDVRYILENYISQGSPSDKQTKLLSLWLS